MTESFEKLLLTMEQQNLDALSHNEKHRFPRNFDKKALAICRGEKTAPTMSRRRMPLWACVLILILLAAMVTGCALAYFLPRAIPYYGIVDNVGLITVYSTTEPLSFAGLDIETVLYIKDGEEGRLLMWAHSETDIPYGFYPNSPPAAEITVGGNTYDLMCYSKNQTENGYAIVAEARNVPAEDETAMRIKCGKSTKRLRLIDVSDKGYTVSRWAEIEGLHIKMLPIYTNNRSLLMTVDGIENASISASIHVYDSLGNTATASGGIYMGENSRLIVCDQSLPSDIVKIQITALRVWQTIAEQSFTLPLSSQNPNTVLLDTPAFTEQVDSVKWNGTYWAIRTRIIPKSPNINDVEVTYDFSNANRRGVFSSRNENGEQIFTYYIEASKNTAELYLTVDSYKYNIRSENGSPLDEICIEKK